MNIKTKYSNFNMLSLWTILYVAVVVWSKQNLRVFTVNDIWEIIQKFKK